MAFIFGKEYSRQELLARVGNISQVCGVKMMELMGGKSEGVTLARMWTGSGLDFDVNVSRGMGIGAFRYKGMALSWMSATGDVAPWHYEPAGNGLDRSYAGGLMHNGGLRQVGAPCTDEGEDLGLHGRIANLPAEQFHWDAHCDHDEYVISVSGKVREASALGENLLLTRKISAKMGGDEVLLEDTVENEAPVSSPLMILYHTNFGFPLVDEGTRLVIASKSVVDASDGKPAEPAAYGRCQGPRLGAGSQIYFHKTDGREGTSGYLVANENLGLGLLVSYEKQNLPELIQWMDLEQGRYVIEVGPSNCKCFGRKAEREAGTLQFLEPGERKTYSLRFRILEGRESLRKAESNLVGTSGGAS